MAFVNPDQNVAMIPLKEGMRVADFGSGTGAYALAAARIVGATGKVYAIEIQKDLLLNIATNAQKEGLTAVEGVWGNLEEAGGIRLADRAVDAVIIANTLFQTPDREMVFKEAYRVLRPGGKFLVIDWTDSFGGLGPRTSDVVIEARATEYAIKHGFTPERSFVAGDHHYGAVFVKQIPE